MNSAWTEREDEQLRRLKGAGLNYVEMAAQMGRKPNACKSRWFYISMTPTQKQRRLDQHNANRKERHGYKPTEIHVVDERLPIVVPDHVMAERNERLSRLPASISELLLGDPHPSRSALARKLAEARA